MSDKSADPTKPITPSLATMEMNTLIQRDQYLGAFAYLFFTFGGGFTCFYAGTMLVKP